MNFLVHCNRMQCVCLICFKPNDIWIEFLKTFTTYHVYIVIDDNSIDYKEKYSLLENITLVQINNEECKENGFINMNFTIKKLISGWDKALYYFSSINTGYNNVWFFEDDVFFYNEDTLLRIDSKYNNSDLLTRCYTENISGSKNLWHWSKIDIKFSPPYYKAMVCSLRVSSLLLSKIKSYATEHKTLFFLEALFPTICKKYKLQYDIPDELINIFWRKRFNNNEININTLYHPVRDISKHKYYRDIVLKNRANG